MPAPGWFVHLQGETLGPLTTEKVIAMLTQNRVQFADFAWRNGFTKWVRISEVDEFAGYLPSYPKTGIPGEGKDRTAVAEAEAESESETVQSPEAEEPAPRAKAAAKSAQSKTAPKVAKMPSRYLRIPIPGKVSTSGQGSFDIINIAERGVFVASNQPLELGTEIQFRLESPAFPETLQMRGVVIRHVTDQEPIGFAIEFVRLNPVHKNLIEQYVRTKSEEES